MDNHESISISVGNIPIEMVDSRILVISIEEKKPESQQYKNTALPFGSEYNYIHKNALQVRVKFIILERNIYERRRVMEKIKKWTGQIFRAEKNNTGVTTLTQSTSATTLQETEFTLKKPGTDYRKILRLTGRLNQFIVCDYAEISGFEKSQNWLEEMECVFTAAKIPFWQSDYKASATAVNKARGTIKLSPTGDKQDCPADFNVVSLNPVTSFSIGGVVLNFSQFSTKEFMFTHDDRGLVEIFAVTSSGTVDALYCQTESSDDDLRLVAGEENVLTFACSNSVKVKVQCGGMWE